MIVFIGKRLAHLVITMVVVSLALFLVLELDPGNVAQKVLGPYSSNEQREIWMEKHGFRRR
jgi:peptide/nickel transport system permease protein